MIKLVLFDLDGVLIDAKGIHYKALNDALGDKYSISEEDHMNLYDGLKTFEKLKKLSERKGLPQELHNSISAKKQEITLQLIRELKPLNHLIDLFKRLDSEGYAIGVCSNSVRRTVITSLAKVGLIEYCSIILSNEDVKNSKPHPEIYWKAMAIMNVTNEETLIIEDSPPGLVAADRTGCSYVRVKDPHDTTYEKISKYLKGEKMTRKWKSENLNILIPMAGAGSRFANAGYTFPKPLIDVNGKPMIQLVVDNLGLEGTYHFIVQKSHRQQYNLDNMLNLISPGCRVIEVDGVTEGAACTSLLAKEFIDNDNPLFFANSDQFADWNPIEFMYKMQETDCDGGIVTFDSTHPKWSFASIDDNGIVMEVAEKNPISKHATVGFYYWKKGSDFVKYAEQMIEKDIRVNNEFYVCPVFNEAIKDRKKIRTYDISEMWGLGTPEDLEYFLKNKKG